MGRVRPEIHVPRHPRTDEPKPFNPEKKAPPNDALMPAVRGMPEARAGRVTRVGTYRGVGGAEVDTDDLLRDDAEGLVGGDAAAHGHRASLEGLAGEAGHADSLTAAGEGLADLHGAGGHGGLSGDTSAHLVSLA